MNYMEILHRPVGKTQKDWKGIATEKKGDLQEHGPDNPKDRDSDPGIADRAASEEGGCITDVLAREWTRVGIDGVTACCWGRCHCCFCPFDCLSVLDCEV